MSCSYLYNWITKLTTGCSVLCDWVSRNIDVRLSGCVIRQETSWGGCWWRNNGRRTRPGHCWPSQNRPPPPRRCSRDPRRPIGERRASRRAPAWLSRDRRLRTHDHVDTSASCMTSKRSCTETVFTVHPAVSNIAYHYFTSAEAAAERKMTKSRRGNGDQCFAQY